MQAVPYVGRLSIIYALQYSLGSLQPFKVIMETTWLHNREVPSFTGVKGYFT